MSRWLVVVLLVNWLFAMPAIADVPPRTAPDFARLLDEAGIDPRPGAAIPLDVVLRDETGADIRLAEVCSGKPVVLALVYYRCPMLCGMVLDSLTRNLTSLSLTAGQDFTVLAVSFDPRETAELAAAARKTALARYGRDGAEDGFRFLTGDAEAVRTLADAVGFHYRYDESTGQFAHAAGLVILTPEGMVSRYLFGVDYPHRDLRLALVEASRGAIGTSTDRVLLLCYHYDPTTGRYGLAVMGLLRAAGAATVVALAVGIGLMLRRERRSSELTTPRFATRS